VLLHRLISDTVIDVLTYLLIVNAAVVRSMAVTFTVDWRIVISRLLEVQSTLHLTQDTGKLFLDCVLFCNAFNNSVSLY